MPPLTRPTPSRTSPRLRWWSLSSVLILSIAATLLLLLPTSEQSKAKSPTATAASGRTKAMAAPEAIAAPTGGAAELTKWEYATVALPSGATEQTLDTWGDDGWDLVQVVPNHPGPDGNQLVAYLKRPKFA